STLINKVTNASAKVGAYPFTTIHPQLGVVRHKSREFVLADIPGLIEGAADGAGIGDRFLGHIERCRILLHLVDATGDDPVNAWKTVSKELEKYGGGLAEKPQILALNKADLLDDELMSDISEQLRAAGAEHVLPVSGATGDGLEAALNKVLEAVGENSSIEQKDQPTIAPGEEEATKTWSPL
ncbi:MAG: GTPase, partial [Parasphingorhabdus sp.]